MANPPDLLLVGESDYYLPETKTTDFSPLYEYLCAPLRELSFPFQYQLNSPQRLALAALAGYLRERGFHIEAVDNIFRDPAEIARFEELLASHPLAVGISTSCMKNAATIPRIAATIRRLSPYSKIIIGGSGSASRSEMRQAADLTVLGAGEPALAEILPALKAGKDLLRLPGLTMNLDISGNRLAAAAELAPTLISAPAWDAFKIRHSQCFSVAASLGCAYKCVFCSFPERGRQRYRPVERVVDEAVRNAKQFGARYLRFVDNNLTSRTEYVLALCAAMKTARLRIPWSCFARADELADSPALCHAMAEAGCFWIYSGIESGETGILEAMHKKLGPDAAYRGITNAKAAGIMMHGNFMVGFPGETPTTLKNTLAFIKKSGLDTVSFSILGMTPDMAGHMSARGLKAITHEEASAITTEAIRDIFMSEGAPLLSAHGITMYYLLGGGLTLPDTLKYYSSTRDFHRTSENNDKQGKNSALETISRLYSRTAARFGGVPSGNPAAKNN